MPNKPNNKEDKEKSVPYCSNAPCLHDRPQKHCVACCPLPNNKVEEIVETVFQAVMEDIGKRYKVSDTLSDILSDSLFEQLSQALTSSYEQGVKDERERIEKWARERLGRKHLMSKKEIPQAEWKGYETSLQDLLQALKNN